MTVLMVAACNSNYHMGKLDIKGAFYSNGNERHASVYQV
jgi:hypothetical protein